MRTRADAYQRILRAISSDLSDVWLDRIATILDGLADDRTVDYTGAWLSMTTRHIRESLDRTEKP